MKCFEYKKPNFFYYVEKYSIICRILKNKKSHCCIVFSFILINPFTGIADTVQVQRQDWITLSESMVSKEKFLLPIGQLSTQLESPFMFFGGVMDESHPRWKQYSKALKEHPDTLSCLIKSERGNSIVNTLNFDWVEVDGGAEMDVCVFRVLDSIEDPILIADWFRYQGFRVIIFNDPTPTRPYSEMEPRRGFDAGISSAAFCKLRSIQRSWLYRVLGFDLTYSVSFTIRFSSNLKLVDSSVMSNTN